MLAPPMLAQPTYLMVAYALPATGAIHAGPAYVPNGRRSAPSDWRHPCGTIHAGLAYLMVADPLPATGTIHAGIIHAGLAYLRVANPLPATGAIHAAPSMLAQPT